MSRFQDNLSVIPRAAKVTAWIVALGCAVLVGILSTFPPDHSEPVPLVGRILLPILAFATLFTYIALIGYVYGDSKRRGMRYVMWTLLAMFIPNAIGIILYFILRDPLMKPCPFFGSIATPCSPARARACEVSSASCGRGETHSPHLIRSSAAAASSTSGLKPNEIDASGTP